MNDGSNLLSVSCSVPPSDSRGHLPSVFTVLEPSPAAGALKPSPERPGFLF